MPSSFSFFIASNGVILLARRYYWQSQCIAFAAAAVHVLLVGILPLQANRCGILEFVVALTPLLDWIFCVIASDCCVVCLHVDQLQDLLTLHVGRL